MNLSYPTPRDVRVAERARVNVLNGEEQQHDQ